MAREAKRMGVPFMMGAQGTYGVKPLTEQPERFFLKYAYGEARAIVVPSEYTKATINKEANEQYDITIIHNGVDYERFRNALGTEAELKKQYEGKRILLTVGQVKNRKGQDLVIRALPQILKEHPNTMYLIVGDDGWGGYLEKLADEIGVRDHVVFVGPVESEKVSAYFHACDVYVHTARIAGDYFFEGFGIVYLEAGACGKPSVGTKAGGITDALIHEKTGFVAPNEDVDTVAQYVNSLLGDESLRTKMGEEGRAYAQEHMWDKVTDRFIELYQSLLT
jgi:phosphatidylinositol alpha-1,6-mannosyltransferase